MRPSAKKTFVSTLVVATLALLLVPAPAGAIIVFSKADRNTRAPHGSLVDSGWQWQGQFGSFLGTPIAKNYFITSGHIGGSPGQPFFYNGQAYNTVAFYDDPSTDLRIWKIDGKFPSWAPLFKDTSEVGRSCVIYGRGTQRGEPVFANGQLKGWQWGPTDGLQSWGRNSIVGVADGGDKRGDLIYFNFDQFGNSHEGTLSAGDSGGGLFVKQGRIWKLAGINTSVDGPYALNSGETPFNAAIFDRGGLIVPGINNGDRIPDSTADNPAAAYATRISSNLPWITGVLAGKISPGGVASASNGVPEPTGALITITGLSALALRRRRAPKSQI